MILPSRLNAVVENGALHRDIIDGCGRIWKAAGLLITIVDCREDDDARREIERGALRATDRSDSIV